MARRLGFVLILVGFLSAGAPALAGSPDCQTSTPSWLIDLQAAVRASETKGVHTKLCRNYPPALDGHYLDSRYLLNSENHYFITFRGWHDAESPTVVSEADEVWDVGRYGEDPMRMIRAMRRAWKGHAVKKGITPVFYFAGHCLDFDKPQSVPGSSTVQQAASHTTGPSERLWKPAEIAELVKVATEISPDGVRPRFVFGGCGMAFPKNRAFLAWLSRQPGRPIVVASEARCSTTFWNWPSMTNILIFNNGKHYRLGDPHVPSDIREW